MQSGGRGMVFSSLVFLYAFLPAVLAVYFLSPKRWKNAVLLIFSLLFYGWGEPKFIFLMVASFTAAYALGFPIAKYRSGKPAVARRWTVLSLAVSLSALLFFKYYDFGARTLSSFPFWNLPVLGLSLPVGISFYTFQIMSYTIDLYRGDADLQRNYAAFGTYVSLFPQLIAGPIVRYREIDGQLRERTVTVSDFAAGVERFCVGLAKKGLLGDPLASGWSYFRDALTVSPSALGAWASVVLYSLHLYFDFSGYSDMAIGLGRMFGFRFPENFRHPYAAESVTDFWRRWHITLSTWFREYVYIPLGGNRAGKAKQFRNFAIVWILTGLWHGADWNFLLWGVWFLFWLSAERFLLGKERLARIPLFLRRAVTLLVVFLGFLLFSESDLPTVGRTLGYLVGVNCRFSDMIDLYRLRVLLPLLAVAAIGSTPLPYRLFLRFTEQRRFAWVRPVLCVLSLLFVTAYLVDKAFSPFEYFHF